MSDGEDKSDPQSTHRDVMRVVVPLHAVHAVHIVVDVDVIREAVAILVVDRVRNRSDRLSRS